MTIKLEVADISMNVVVAVCAAAAERLGAAIAPQARRVVSTREIPDDRPTQSSVTEYVTEVQLGAVRIDCVEQVGGWVGYSASFTCDDFFGTGRLVLSAQMDSVELEAGPTVAPLLASLLAAHR